MQHVHQYILAVHRQASDPCAARRYYQCLTAEGKLYGGEIAYTSELNPVTNLMNGMFRLDCQAASPIPAQQIDMHVQYSVDMLEAALGS